MKKHWTRDEVFQSAQNDVTEEKYILKAVNSHELLLDACEEAWRALTNFKHDGVCFGKRDNEALDLIRETLIITKGLRL